MQTIVEVVRMTVQELREEAEKLGYRIIKVNPPRVAKYIKCKDCVYLTGEKTQIGIMCMNPNKTFKTSTAHYKYPHAKACMKFKRKEIENVET